MPSFLTIYPAGMNYYVEDVAKMKEGFTEGDNITLIPEPDNKFDDKAIKLLWIGTHIGYVPHNNTGPVHKFLEEGFTVTGQIVETGRSIIDLYVSKNEEGTTKILGDHFKDDLDEEIPF